MRNLETRDTSKCMELSYIKELQSTTVTVEIYFHELLVRGFVHWENIHINKKILFLLQQEGFTEST